MGGVRGGRDWSAGTREAGGYFSRLEDDEFNPRSTGMVSLFQEGQGVPLQQEAVLLPNR